MQRVVMSALSAVVVAVLSQHAVAQTAGAGESRIGGAKGWDAYAYTETGAKGCYLFGAPEKKHPANPSRGRVDVYVTHRPGEKALNVVHFDAGYPYKDGSTAELEI